MLAGYRRTAGDRGRGVESDQVAAARGRLDAVLAGLLFMGGLRRSEVSARRWADVEDAGDADGILVTVRRSKTNQMGKTSDVRYLKNGPARAVRALEHPGGDRNDVFQWTIPRSKGEVFQRKIPTRWRGVSACTTLSFHTPRHGCLCTVVR